MGLASDLDLAWLELPLAASTHLHLAFETVDQTAELPETDGLEPCCLLGYPASLADKPSDAQKRPLLDGACILTLSIESSRRRSPIFDLLTGDALALMDARGAGRFHLVGHDWGGQLAWLIAAAHPQRIATLTMLSRPHPAAFARALVEDPEQAGALAAPPGLSPA
jgi:pimeloyl-ACP methyl ester carboxylesterase